MCWAEVMLVVTGNGRWNANPLVLPGYIAAEVTLAVTESGGWNAYPLTLPGYFAVEVTSVVTGSGGWHANLLAPPGCIAACLPHNVMWRLRRATSTTITPHKNLYLSAGFLSPHPMMNY